MGVFDGWPACREQPGAVNSTSWRTGRYWKWSDGGDCENS